MTEVWYSVDLQPDDESLDQLLVDVKSPAERARYATISRRVDVHRPLWRLMTDMELQRFHFSQPGHRYLVIRLGCELDPNINSRSPKIGFAWAHFGLTIWGDGVVEPTVSDLFPLEINAGKPSAIRLTFEPSVKVADQFEAGLGSIEGDVAVGQVAAVTRGFKGEGENSPYWKLSHHREAPLYGVRHFWLRLAIPSETTTLFLRTSLEAAVQTLSGSLTIRTKLGNGETPVFIINMPKAS